MAGNYSLRAVQKLPVSIETAWDYFSDPSNLQSITPPAMGFKVISHHHGERMYPGQIIEYKIKPLLGISLYWMTEITHVDPLRLFVDEQRRGPYRLWHHQHQFKSIEGGTEMTDIVHYQLPFWLLGKIAQVLTVKKQLRQIFQYRYTKIEELFGSWPGQEVRVEFY